MRYLLIVLAILATACANTEARTRTALDTIATVVDPAYEAAMDGCAARAEAITAELKAEGFKQAYADEAEKFAKRCDKTRDAFELIRALHKQAVTALEAGLLDKAQALYGKLLMAWGALKGGS